MTHRVGTITLGVTMISIGVIYLLQLFFGILDYLWIWKLWPVIFIMLGVEILVSNARTVVQFILFKSVIVLIFVMRGFAFFMALLEKAVEAGGRIWIG